MSEAFLGATAPVTPEGGSPAPEGNPVVQGNPEYTEFLQAITNQEGKPKYKTVADALIGAAKAQEHIARIEQENSELRGVAKKVETIEQVLQRLEMGKGNDTPAPRIEDSEKLVLSVIERHKAAEREQANKLAVLTELKSKFGDKTDDALSAKANELGLSVQELGALAARSPKAVLSYFGAESKSTPAVHSTVNTQALKPNEQQVGAPGDLSSTKELVNYWRSVKAEVNKSLGL